MLASGAFSAVIGEAGALAGQRWQRQHEREEAMRTRMIGSADAFTTEVTDCLGHVVRDGPLEPLG